MSIPRAFLVCAAVAAAAAGCHAAAAPPAAAPAPAAPAPVASADSAPQTTAEDLTAPPGQLKLAAIRLLTNGKPGLVLDPDGTVEVPGKGEVGRVERDGRFLDAHDKPLLQLTPEGELVLPNGDYLPVTIDKNGAVHLLKENRVVRLHDDGTLEGANPAGPTVHVEGATPATRRTAMFLLVLAGYQLQEHP